MTNVLLRSEPPRHEPPSFISRKIPAGRVLFVQGECCPCVYVVRSGTLKSVCTLADGREQVCAFPMTGDVVALDGLASGTHGTTLTALEDSHVSVLAWRPLAQPGASDADMQQRLNVLMAQDILRGHKTHALLGRSSAQDRLAAFLLDQSRRWQAQGCSPSDFHLRMSRAEIGNFLCMSLETVSRALSGLQRSGWLRVDKRRIVLADVGAFSRRFGALL